MSTLHTEDVERLIADRLDGLSLGLVGENGEHEAVLHVESGFGITFPIRCATHGDLIGRWDPLLGVGHLHACTGPHERTECRNFKCNNEAEYPSGFCGACEEVFN